MTDVLINAIDAPHRSQWEDSSGTFEYSQKYNCGPTCASFIAGYYHDGKPSIEHTRTLAGVPRGRGTTYPEQARMLGARKIPAVLVDCLSIDHLKRLVKNGRRPIILAIYMGRVPLAYRGYNFSLWHSITLLGFSVKNGVEGAMLNDPNFVDKKRCRRWWPNWVLQQAFLDNVQSWAIVPHEKKHVVVVFDEGVDGINIRKSPDHRKDNVYAIARTKGPNGIYRKSDGKRIAPITRRFNYIRTVTGPDGWRYAHVHEFGRSLYIRRRYVHLDD